MRQVFGLSIAAALAVFLTACGHSEPQPKINISIERTGPFAWKVIYLTEKPVDGLIFLRRGAPFRASTWAIGTPGIHIADVGDDEIVYGDHGAFNGFEATFTSFVSEMAKDYEFFVPYTDGGISMYTGHLEVVPLTCSEKVLCKPQEMAVRNEPFATELTLIPRQNEHVVVAGVSSPGAIAGERRATYVYFGRQEPRDFGDFTGILDSELPSWVYRTLQVQFGRFLKYYSAKTGYSLKNKPTVYFPYSPSMTAYSAKGGVLPGQVRLVIAGQYWALGNEENQERLLDLIAHEAAHFWNADLAVPQIDDGDSWMHEGGADAFALRALRDLGLVTQARSKQLETEALNRCVLGIGDIALNQSDRFGRFRNAYDCGAVIATLTEAAARRTSAGFADLFSFWHDLLEEAEKYGGHYTTAMYYALASKEGDGPTAIAIASLVKASHPDVDEFLKKAFLFERVPIESTEKNVPSWYTSEMGSRALRLIGVSNTISYEKAGPYNLAHEGARAYDYIYENCRSKDRVDLMLSTGGSSVVMRCSSIPARPKYLEFR